MNIDLFTFNKYCIFELLYVTVTLYKKLFFGTIFTDMLKFSHIHRTHSKFNKAKFQIKWFNMNLNKVHFIILQFSRLSYYTIQGGWSCDFFFYSNIVSQQIVFAIFSVNLSNLYRPCSREQNTDSSGIKLSNIPLVFFYLCLHNLVMHIFNKK